jgi:hypothetical protein
MGPATNTGFCLPSRKAAAASTAASRLRALVVLWERLYGMGLVSKEGWCSAAGEVGVGGWGVGGNLNG